MTTCPNLILTGSSGTGKTAARPMAWQLIATDPDTVGQVLALP